MKRGKLGLHQARTDWVGLYVSLSSWEFELNYEETPPLLVADSLPHLNPQQLYNTLITISMGRGVFSLCAWNRKTSNRFTKNILTLITPPIRRFRPQGKREPIKHTVFRFGRKT